MKLLANIVGGKAQFSTLALQMIHRFNSENEGKTVVYDFRVFSNQRTTKQNALYWFVLGQIANEMKEQCLRLQNDQQPPSEDDLHVLFKSLFLQQKKVVFFSPETGEKFEAVGLQSSAELTKQEFSDYLENIIKFCIDNLNFCPLYENSPNNKKLCR